MQKREEYAEKRETKEAEDVERKKQRRRSES